MTTDRDPSKFAVPRERLHLVEVPPRPSNSAIADAVMSLVSAVGRIDQDVVSLLEQSAALDVLFRRNIATLDKHEGLLEEHRKLLDRYSSVVARLEQRVTRDVRNVREKLDSHHDEVVDAARQGARDAIQDAVEDHTLPGIGPVEEERVSRTPSDPAMAAKKVGLGVLIWGARGAWGALRFAWRGVSKVLMPVLGMAIVAYCVNFAYQHHWIKAPPEKVLAPVKAAE